MHNSIYESYRYTYSKAIHNSFQKTRDKPGFFANFLASKLPPGRLKQEEEIDPHAVVLLENSRKHKKQKSNKSSYDLSHKKRKTLTVRERKKMKLFKLEKDQQK